MLIRVSGGESGIKEYLEHGQKSGRDLHRDVIDDRVILDGDLELTDTIINGMVKEGERYLHITLSFKEDFVDNNTLQEITSDFKKFLFPAYEDDEFSFYAEAHLPKVKSYIHQRTGELVERKPHIHVVIPEQNLLTGQGLNPLGYVEHQNKFIDAFQEQTNNKYGLASPKDNRRYEITKESEIISRHKGDIFKGLNREIKDNIVLKIIENDITTKDAFKKMLQTMGDIKVRNEGKNSEYINFKPHGEKKGINLKEPQFSRAWIEQKTAEKIKKLSSEVASYAEKGESKVNTTEQEKLLREWYEIRAKEVRYINSGNRKLYQEYRDASRAEKLVILAEKLFQEKHRSDNNVREQPGTPVTNLENDLRTASRHIESASGVDGGAAKGARGVANRRVKRAVRAVVQRHSGDQEQPAQSEEVTKTDSVIGQKRHEHEEVQKQASEAFTFQEIKGRLDASRLLARLSHSHGVQPEKYTITTGKDGGDRIKCGSRNLNVSDFLTKELHLPWDEAKKILSGAYAAQVKEQPQQNNKVSPRAQLWAEYRDEWKPDFFKTKKEQWEEQRQREKESRAELRERYQRLKRNLDNNRTVPWQKKKAALSIARMEKALESKRLTESFTKQRQKLKARYQQSNHELYKQFLQQKAQGGSDQALAELRRQSETVSHAEPSTTKLHSDKPQEPKPSRIISTLDYKIDRRGDVKYSNNERHLFTDAGREVRTFQKDEAALETALQLAIHKFGSRLKINGTDEYKAAILKTVVKAQMHVTFSDSELERQRKYLMQRVHGSRENTVNNAEKTEPVIQKWVDQQNKNNADNDDILLYETFTKKHEGVAEYRGCHALSDDIKLSIYKKSNKLVVVPITDKQFKFFNKKPPGEMVVLNRKGNAQFKQQKKNVHGR